MKLVIKRQIQTLIFIWSSIALYIAFHSFIYNLYQDAYTLEQAKQWMVYLMWFTGAYLLLSILWIIQAYRHNPVKGFLWTEVVALEEDERGEIIDFKARKFASKITQSVGILVFLGYYVYALFSIQWVIEIRVLLIAFGLIYTLYALTYLLKLRALYFE